MIEPGTEVILQEDGSCASWRRSWSSRGVVMGEDEHRRAERLSVRFKHKAKDEYKLWNCLVEALDPIPGIVLLAECADG